MKKFIVLLYFISFLSFSQSGISISGISQFNLGATLIPTEENYIPLSYEQRNHNITLSIFRGRKFRIGTIVLKGSVSYNIEKTHYHNEQHNILIRDYETIKRRLIPSLEIWHILFQSEQTFLYASLGSYGIIQNLNFENHVYEHNNLVPFLRTGLQLNYNRFFFNPFISFDLEPIEFDVLNDIFNTDIKEKINKYSLRTGLEFGIMF